VNEHPAPFAPPSIRDYATSLIAHCFDAAPSHLLGAEFDVYRDMARARIGTSMEESFTWLHAAVGSELFEVLVADFLANRPPTTWIFRDVAGQFVAYLASLPADKYAQLTLRLIELAQYEWLRLQVAQSADIPRAGTTELPVAMDAALALAPSVRLARFAHSVQNAPLGSTHVLPAPTFLVVYREPKQETVEALELTQSAYLVLYHAGVELHALQHSAQLSAQSTATAIDRAWLAGFAELLASLIARGVVLGGCAIVQ
jgi:uncharacterized protein